MIEGYFLADEQNCYRYPYINVMLASTPDDHNSIEVPFVIDTGADRSLISPFDGQRLCRQLDIDMQSLRKGKSIGGIGGDVPTRLVRMTLFIGSYRTTMPIPIVDQLPGRYDMPSLLGRDIIYDFTLLIEHSADRLFLLRDAAELYSLLEH
ncbi:MAG: hypothetical protein OXI16_05900 [Chloroflexota bacterium]|nr:hypothetical protein [Chloroflexota bacterium]